MFLPWLKAGPAKVELENLASHHWLSRHLVNLLGLDNIASAQVRFSTTQGIVK